ncbi:MAG: hypothetical protein HN802_01590 [Candidatus Jacksonbacteria bacterium]|jgi:hypothetical protein|nr:hypothetical protein [Candidatus Jacksonbacteria bacterium]
MAKKEKEQVITVDEKEYKVADLTEEQIAMVNHIGDLTRKIETSTFNLQQLNFGKSAFVDALKVSLGE